jgi:HD-like signal output (HDOD) protein
VTWQDWIGSGAWERNVDGAMPMLPALANEVMHLALDPEVSASRITAVVSKDPTLAANVIRLANTGFNAPPVPVTTVSDAVVRVGTRAVRNAVMTECLHSRVINPRVYGSGGRDLIDHAIGTAYLSWLIAERAHEAPEEAFLYGLLHDLGKLLIWKLVFDFSRETMSSPSDDDVTAFMAGHHAALGGRLLRKWELPDHLHDPVVWHHEPDRAESHPQSATVVYVANRLAHRYGFGCEVELFDPLEDPVFGRLGFDARALEQTDGHAPGLFEIARQVSR